MADKKKVEDEEPTKKKSGILKWILLLALLVALGAGGFFAYRYFFMSKTDSKNPVAQGEVTNASSDENKEQTAEGKPQQTQMFTLPPFVVNLADPLGRRYLKISLDIELKDSDALDATTKAIPKIKDTLLLLLSSKSFEDLSSVEDKIVLKNEIMSRLGQILGSGKVLNVYFTEFIVQ